MKTATLLILLTTSLLTTSCGIGDFSEPISSNGIIVFSRDVLPEEGLLGWYQASHDGSTEIWVKTGLPGSHIVAVVMHELMHAVGFQHHTDQPCLLNTVVPVNDPTPCDWEVEAMREVTQTFRVTVAQDIRFPTTIAMDRWNAAVGREMFVLAE